MYHTYTTRSRIIEHKKIRIKNYHAQEKNHQHLPANMIKGWSLGRRGESNQRKVD